MASQDLTARLQYLKDSAHLLATTAPATSKYLMSKCSSFMFDNNIELSESDKRTACGACGTIIILGWDSKLEVESQRCRRGKSVSGKAGSGLARAVVSKCESCGKKTRLNILTTPASVPKHKSSLSQSVTLVSNTSLHSASPQSFMSNSTIEKKRTKSRRSGLEAVLARQKAAAAAAASSSPGFDLLDFMKTA